jgi:hypothetical protein
MSEPLINPPSERPANRLAIAHLLLWTATTALAIGTIMPDPVDAPAPADMPAEFRAYQDRQQEQWRIATVLTGPVLGAGLAALAIAYWRQLRHEPNFPTQPGHWILMIVGMCTVVAMELHLIDRVRLDGFGSNFIRTPLFVFFWVTILLPVITLAVAYYRVAEPRRWKRVFAIAGGSLGLLFLALCCPLWPSAADLIILAILYATPISMVVAAVLDVRSGRTYDVFHWVGVVAVPALAIILTGLTVLG